QTLIARHVLARHHRTLLNRSMAAQHGFDFLQLDAETANLDLVVNPALKLNPPVREIASQVAGLVHAGVRNWRERVGDKLLGGQFRPLEENAGHPVSADVNLARHSRWNWLQMVVEDVDLRVGQGTAHYHRLVGGTE